MIKVFYDGKCALCSKEINHYRKIAPSGIFDWQDITESADEIKKEGISLAEGLKQLHAQDEEGMIQVGVDAFILIWKQLKLWRVLADFVGLPIIKPMANILYRYFAKRRFQQLKHCQLAEKQEGADYPSNKTEKKSS